MVLRWLFLAACAPGFAFPLVAQTPDSLPADTAVMVEPIEVRSAILPVAHPRIGSGIPARLTVIPRAALAAWRPRLPGDALATRAGVSVYDDLGAPYKVNLASRGFSVGPTVGLPAGISVFLDGVRQNEPDASQVNFDLLPMHLVERIELLSGAGSLLGPNSLGGAVNLVTRRGTGPASAEVELGGGSFEAWSAAAEAGGSSGGRDWFGAASVEREDGWREATGATRFSFFGNTGWTGEARGFRIQALAARARAETAGSLPESIFGSSPVTNFTAGDFEDLNSQQVVVSGFSAAGSGRVSVSAHLRRADAERFNVNQAPDDNVRSRTRTWRAGLTGDWSTSAEALGGMLGFRAGADLSLHRARIRLFQEDFEDPSIQELTTEVESPGSDVAAFALADLRIGRITLSAGLRGDRVVVPFRDRLDPAEDTTSIFTQVSPRAGVALDVGDNAALFVSAGQAFRAPVILELACADPEAACPLPFALGDDPPLDPVTAVTLEAGGRLAAGPLGLSASAYRTSVRNEIVFVASEEAVLAGYFANLDRSRREGIEVAATASPLPWLGAYANYALTRATYQSPAQPFSIRSEDEFENAPFHGPNDVTPGDRMPLVPAHQLRFGVLATHSSGLAGGADARWTGRQWLRGDEGNETSPLGDYFSLALMLGWETERWGVTGTVTNLLGSRAPIFGTYNENRGTGELERFLTPMEARRFTVSVRHRLGAAPGRSEVAPGE